MTEKPINNYTFKASFKAHRGHFMPKVVSRRITVKDAFDGRYRSSICVFMPKLDPQYTKARAMFHVSNGASSCLIRFKSPDEIVKALEEIIKTLKSDKWLDAWWQLSDISEELLDNNKITLDEEFVDINAWHKALEDTVDIELVQVKKEMGGEK
jgi:hypothetical protein